MAEWSELSLDILNKIAMRFETIEDLVYFSVVCRSWNHVFNTVKHVFNAKTTPWLLLAENTKNNPHCFRKVFNPCNNKYYQLKLPETFGCRCWGSAYGWLVTYNEDLDLHLFNPLTKARISLPPISRLPFLWDCHFQCAPQYSFQRMKRFYIRKAFVLKLGEDDFVVFVSYYFAWKKFAFARPGDESWTSIDHLGRTMDDLGQLKRRLNNFVAEVICRGTRLLFLYEDTSIGYLNISDLSDPRKLVARDYIPKPPLILRDPQNLCIKVKRYMRASQGISDDFDPDNLGAYLINSCGGLFMVMRDRCLVDEKDDYATFGFEVYKLDFEKKKWSRVHHLGNSVVLVGNASSMAVPAVRALNCKPNSIYYTDDEDCIKGVEATLRGDDMGVFDVEQDMDDVIDEECYTSSKLQTPLWFMPRF